MTLSSVLDKIYSHYKDFSTIMKTVGPSGSLEALHDDYRYFIVGGGRMSSVLVAAFDPVFWLHHWYFRSPELLIQGRPKVLA